MCDTYLSSQAWSYQCCRGHVVWTPNQWSNLMFFDKSLFSLKSDSRYVVLRRNLACDVTHHLYVNCTNTEVEAYSKRLRSKNLRFSTIHTETESPLTFISERPRIKLKFVRVIHWGTVAYMIKFWISKSGGKLMLSQSKYGVYVKKQDEYPSAPLIGDLVDTDIACD